jgi:hypothetical protein
MPLTLDRPAVPDLEAPDTLLMVLPVDPPEVTPDVARVLLRLLRAAVPELGQPRPDDEAA